MTLSRPLSGGLVGDAGGGVSGLETPDCAVSPLFASISPIQIMIAADCNHKNNYRATYSYCGNVSAFVAILLLCILPSKELPNEKYSRDAVKYIG
jgi:hypothetical protein